MKTTNTEKAPQLNWLFGGNPGAIEAQEAQGQEEFVASLQLPRKCNSHRGTNVTEQYHKMGIKVFTGSKGDDLFIGVKLPEGWEKRSTDHSMWNELVDDKGRVRATIFYKAAFYDRDSFINFETAITQRVAREAWFNKDYSDRPDSPLVGRVCSADGTILFETDKVRCSGCYNIDGSWNSEGSDEEDTIKESMEFLCKEYLKENYPDWKDINAYW